MRREYNINSITINGREIEKIIIDPHVDKHADHITDKLIKELIMQLDGGFFLPEKEIDGFAYFATAMKIKQKRYKLVWLLEKNYLYVGIITAYRDRRIK